MHQAGPSVYSELKKILSVCGCAECNLCLHMKLNAWHYSSSLIICQWNHVYITHFIIEKKFKKIDAAFQMCPNILDFFQSINCNCQQLTTV